MTALLELSVVPYLKVGGAEPDLVLIFAVIWTIVFGIEGGLVWAFFGGVIVDALALRPLGSTAFALLLAVGGAAIFGRVMARGGYLSPIAAVFVFSLMSRAVLVGLYAALRGPLSAIEPLANVPPGALYDTALAAVIAPIAVAIRSRYGVVDRIDW